ncbi:ABC transporter I family member 10 isoform X1 [Camellia sinensis]|uniref:ABC transporter I family member 10 isoform X1 n=1 Tax=Camellia sinensis TaxID=4442 RepID=UPI0010362FDE|nr:ABC transporter I family member 10 isoform X1 [Camellia sinensis]
MMRPIYAKLIPSDLGTPPKKTRQPVKLCALGSLGKSRILSVFQLLYIHFLGWWVVPGNAVNEKFAIECRNLSFSITTGQGKFVSILKDCSLCIPSGQFWMLLGPNGCGKSTLLKILAGILKPTDGFVYVKKPKSFVFQNPDHQVVMPTVESDLAFGLHKFNLTPDEIKSRLARALDAVGMFEYLKTPVQTLSGGQKQRVAIAGALAEACKVLLLDELTTFLDEGDQIEVIKAVKNSLQKSKDVTALWVTHRLEELEYADGAVYMEDGRVVMHGDVSTILDFITARQNSYIRQINS